MPKLTKRDKAWAEKRIEQLQRMQPATVSEAKWIAARLAMWRGVLKQETAKERT